MSSSQGSRRSHAITPSSARPSRAMLAVTLALLAGISTNAWASSVSREWLRGPIAEKSGEFEACLDSAIRADAEFKGGKVTTRYVIETTGNVTWATTTKNTSGNKPLAACVRRVFLSLDYGSKVDKRITVTYPFVFKVDPPK